MTRGEICAHVLSALRPIAEQNGIKNLSIATDPAAALNRVMAAKAEGLLVLSYEGQDRTGDECVPAAEIATRFALWLVRTGSSLAAPDAQAEQSLDAVCETFESALIGMPMPDVPDVAPYAIYEATRPVTDPSGTPLAGYKITFTIKRGV